MHFSIFRIFPTFTLRENLTQAAATEQRKATMKSLTVIAAGMRTFTQADLQARSDVVELSVEECGRSVRGVRLDSLLGRIDQPDAAELILSSSSDGFSARLPLVAASEVGLIWFANADGPLTEKQGGPFRFFIPGAAECKTAVLDTCANVKFVDRIEVTRAG